MVTRADDEDLLRIAEPDPIRRYGPGAAILIAGFLASGVIFATLRHAEIVDATQQFAILSGERSDLLQKQVDTHMQVLVGVRALFDSSTFVDATEFAQYSRQFVERIPHMHALEWIPRVPLERRAEFEAQASKALNIDYRIRECDSQGRIQVAAQRSEYRPIYYSQARDGASRIGIDVFNRPENAAAMHAAATRNDAAASRVMLREPGVEPMELAFVYRPIFDKTTGDLVGFVRASIALGEMLQAAARDASRLGMAVELLQPGAAGPSDNSILTWRGDVQIADLKIALRFWSTGAYANAPRLLPINALLAGGVLISLVGAIAAFQLTRRRLSLQSLTRALMDEVKERRLSEQKLSLSEARYRVLVENSPDAVILHMSGRVVFANAACARLFKAKSPDDMLGRSVFDLTRADCHDLVRSRMNVMLEQRVVLPSSEQVYVCDDGSTVDVEVLAVPFETDAGIVIQATARDITQRKANDAERKRLEAALQQSQKIEALGTLAGGIAHDFNNILSAIIGNTRLLLDDLPKSDHASQTVREISKAAHRARDLVKRIAAFSRAQESQRVEVAIAPLVREVQQLLRATLPAGIEIVVQMPDESPWVLGDATQIHQVLLNICTNAWQAIAGTGRIEITVTCVDAVAASAHTMTTLEAAQYVCVEVRDTGSGMTPEVTEHIFEPFYTTKSPGQGSGLGLAVVHGIVQNHRGGIAVQSTPERGTTFSVYLPACAAPAHSVDTPVAIAVSGNRRHVLYVDDEEPLVFLVIRILERDGYRCTGSHDVAQALELIRAAPQSFDLIVTDLNMPRMSGLDLAREVKSIRPDLPVIITTGYIRSGDVALAKELGARAIVLKPDTIDEMGALVAAHLQ